LHIYDGTGSTAKYPNSTIEACHYLRMVFKLPLRQTQGFIENILEMLGLGNLQCPDYTLLSKRLCQLGFDTPKFKRNEKMDDDIVAIAIDSTGLKRFGRDEGSVAKFWLSTNVSNSRHYYAASA
jgi:hypothetical protein